MTNECSNTGLGAADCTQRATAFVASLTFVPHLEFLRPRYDDVIISLILLYYSTFMQLFALCLSLHVPPRLYLVSWVCQVHRLCSESVICLELIHTLVFFVWCWFCWGFLYTQNAQRWWVVGWGCVSVLCEEVSDRSIAEKLTRNFFD